MRILLVLAALGLLAFLGLKGVPFMPAPAGGPGAAEAVLYADSSDGTTWDAERFLQKHGYTVRVRDITVDAAAHAEYIRLGAGELPIILLEGDRVNGFRSWEVERIIDRARRSR
jgi:hypothetical protein